MLRKSWEKVEKKLKKIEDKKMKQNFRKKMSSHHSDQMSQRSQVSRVTRCMSKVKVPGSWRLSGGSNGDR